MKACLDSRNSSSWKERMTMSRGTGFKAETEEEEASLNVYESSSGSKMTTGELTMERK